MLCPRWRWLLGLRRWVLLRLLLLHLVWVALCGRGMVEGLRHSVLIRHHAPHGLRRWRGVEGLLLRRHHDWPSTIG